MEPDVNAWVISEEKEKSDLSRYSWNKLAKITILGPLLVIIGSIVTLDAEKGIESYLGCVILYSCSNFGF